MAQVLEQPVAPPARPSRPWWMLVVAMVVALGLGVLGGWLVAGGRSSAPTTAVAGGGEPSTRQSQMVAVVDQFTAAWNAGDGQAVAALFVPTGTLTIVLDKKTYDVVDGSLAGFVASAMALKNVTQQDPTLVGDHFATSIGVLGQGNEQVTVFEFTKGSGSPELVSVQITGDY